MRDYFARQLFVDFGLMAAGRRGRANTRRNALIYDASRRRRYFLPDERHYIR